MNEALEFRKTWSTELNAVLGRRQIQRETTGRYRISRFLEGTKMFLAERKREHAGWDLLSRHKTRAAAIAACRRYERERIITLV